MEEKTITTTLETVHGACRAAYKKGLIQGAQAICSLCHKAPPARETVLGWMHGVVSCNAARIHDLLEGAGGWQVEWPTHDSVER